MVCPTAPSSGSAVVVGSAEAVTVAVAVTVMALVTVRVTVTSFEFESGVGVGAGSESEWSQPEESEFVDAAPSEETVLEASCVAEAEACVELIPVDVVLSEPLVVESCLTTTQFPNPAVVLKDTRQRFLSAPPEH